MSKGGMSHVLKQFKNLQLIIVHSDGDSQIEWNRIE